MNEQATTKKQVATKSSTAVAAPSIDLSLVAQDAGQGLSEVNMDTIQIPFLENHALFCSIYVFFLLLFSLRRHRTKNFKKRYLDCIHVYL